MIAAAALAAVVSLLSFAGPAGASEAGTITFHPAIPCSASPGHYCAKVFYRSVSGGLDVTETESTGYTRGAGRGREWFRYSCSGQKTCYIKPSHIFTYAKADQKLNVTRRFSGSGFFLPCGNAFGVQYRDPAVNAPGPRALLFKVTCTGTRHGLARI